MLRPFRQIISSEPETPWLMLSYGCFLAWLLSFLYNGPALGIVFSPDSYDLARLSLAYILVPSATFFILGGLLLERHRRLFLFWGSGICTAGTLASLALWLAGIAIPWAGYVLAGVMGFASLLFITGWACYFVDSLCLSQMYRHMALVICLGSIMFHFNGLLYSLGIEDAVIPILVLLLMSSLVGSFKLSAANPMRRPEFRIPMPRGQLSMICGMVFLVNLGGGVVQILILPLAEQTTPFIHVLDILVYAGAFVLVANTPRRPPSDIVLTLGMVLVACGFLLYILFPGQAVPGYGMVAAGFVVLDIFIWTLVAETGYIFGRPVRIFTLVMASNLLAVLLGNILGNAMAGSPLHQLEAAGLSAIGAILAFGFMPFVHRRHKMGMAAASEQSTIKETLRHMVIDDHVEQILTPKEKEIFSLMCAGLKNKEISEQAGISENTLKGHARQIYKKLGVKNKKELLALRPGGPVA